MKRVLRRILLILPVFLFLIGHGAKFGFCPCEDSFFLSACECSVHKKVSSPKPNEGFSCCSNHAVHEQNHIPAYENGCDDITAELPDLPYQVSTHSLPVPQIPAILFFAERHLFTSVSLYRALPDIHAPQKEPFDPPLWKSSYRGFLSPLRA